MYWLSGPPKAKLVVASPFGIGTRPRMIPRRCGLARRAAIPWCLRTQGSNYRYDRRMGQFPGGRPHRRLLLARVAVGAYGGRHLAGIEEMLGLAAHPFVDL